MNPLSLLHFTFLIQTLLSDHVTGTAVSTIKGHVNIAGDDCNTDCHWAESTVDSNIAWQWNNVIRQWRRGQTCYYDGQETIQHNGRYECVHYQGTTIPCHYTETTGEFMCSVDRGTACGMVMLHLAVNNVIHNARVNLRLGEDRMPQRRDPYPVGPVVKQYYNSGNVLHKLQSFELSCSDNTRCLEKEITLLAYQYRCETTRCNSSVRPVECF